MEKSIITFSANEQNLQKTGGIGCYASDTVSYIEAQFALGENWNGYDSIRAVWFNDYKTISTVLDPDGVCIVPHEVLVNRGKVMVNLVGSVLVSDELSDRLTTFPCEALKVSAKAKISGSETAEVTPSQFEQFVSIVISEVEKVTGMTAQAETLPAGSQATARYENGILYLGIPQGIRGERGETGADGADGNGITSVVYNADYSLTLIFDNGERFTTPPIRGERGPAGADGRDGTDGADGVTPNISIGNVTTLEPSEDAYVTRRGTDANPIFDFGIPKGDKGDDGTVPDLDLILPTDTASGSIVSIPDGQSVVPVKSLKVTLEPIQDLHGYDKPWSGGAGKNKSSIESYSGAPRGFWGTSLDELVEMLNTLPTGTYTISQDYTIADLGTLSSVRAEGFSVQANGASITSNRSRITDNSPSVGKTYRCSSTFTIADGDVGNIAKCYAYFGAPNYGTFKGTITKIQLELGSSASTFEPYSNICPISGHTEVKTIVSPTTSAEDGTSYTTTLGRTVYGGTLDVVSGELVVDRAYIDNAGELNWTLSDGYAYTFLTNPKRGSTPLTSGLPSELTSFKVNNVNDGLVASFPSGTYADVNAFKSALNQVQLVYELAIPQTYQLDPQTISLLHGNNNVWSDGEVELTYNADVGLYIDKKLGTSDTSTLSMTRTLAKSEDTDDTKSEETETKSELTKSDNIQLAED